MRGPQIVAANPPPCPPLPSSLPSPPPWCWDLRLVSLLSGNAKVMQTLKAMREREGDEGDEGHEGREREHVLSLS